MEEKDIVAAVPKHKHRLIVSSTLAVKGTSKLTDETKAFAGGWTVRSSTPRLLNLSRFCLFDPCLFLNARAIHDDFLILAVVIAGLSRVDLQKATDCSSSVVLPTAVPSSDCSSSKAASRITFVSNLIAARPCDHDRTIQLLLGSSRPGRSQVHLVTRKNTICCNQSHSKTGVTGLGLQAHYQKENQGRALVQHDTMLLYPESIDDDEDPNVEFPSLSLCSDCREARKL
ncbi:hypothetical protein RIF29_33926 [Crotalaria pallida]|uniref:Uncharacterized protein n=1 Tax=Crotalaria pallida TaxID=3830 RepID=A0AAN9EE58_CROPI